MHFPVPQGLVRGVLSLRRAETPEDGQLAARLTRKVKAATKAKLFSLNDIFSLCQTDALPISETGGQHTSLFGSAGYITNFHQQPPWISLEFMETCFQDFESKISGYFEVA